MNEAKKYFDDEALDKTVFRRLIPSLYRRYSKLFLPQFLIRHRYGHRFLLDRSNLVDRSMLYRFGWEGEKYSQFISHVRSHYSESIMFLDIGSHWGLYAIRASQEPAIDEIHAWEPDSRNRAQLHANLFLNALQDRITVHDHALSDHEGVVTFLISVDWNRGTSRIVDSARDGARTVEVPTQRLDNSLAPEGRQIAIKMDVEGGEYSALLGMRNLIANNSIILMIEIADERLDKTFKLLEELGLKFVSEITDKKGETDYLFMK
jgi:FkbM family methyltransferase